MSEPAIPVIPTAIKLHSKSRLLEIAFGDGGRFLYPCEYLRISTPAAGEGVPVHGKRMVGITQLEPQGETALQLHFDDGFSCRYTWAELHALGEHQERNWQHYLQALREHGLERGRAGVAGADGRVRVKLLYFIQLARLAGRDEEEVELPESVDTVASLLDWLGRRRAGWQEAFAADRVQVTVNRHFAEPFTRIEHGDEVALVPRAVQR